MLSLAPGGGMLDISAVDEVLLTGGSSRMPCVREFLASKGLSRITLIPEADTAVALGAALSLGMADVPSEDGKQRSRDVASHSLGYITESPDGSCYVNTIAIPRSSPLPARGTGRLRLRENNTSDMIELYLVQGESTDPCECTVLGKRIISGFSNTGGGMVVDVTFQYDADGMVSVHAEYAGKPLAVTAEDGYGDISWLLSPPSQREIDSDSYREIAYCIDYSRSMWDHMDSVRACVENSSASLDGPNTGYTLIGFADRSKLLCGPGADRETMLSVLRSVPLGFRGLGRGTNAEPFETLYEALGGMTGARFAAVITDGAWESRDFAVSMADSCRKNGITVYAFGIGGGIDRSFLRQIAVSEGAAVN